MLRDNISGAKKLGCSYLFSILGQSLGSSYLFRIALSLGSWGPEFPLPKSLLSSYSLSCLLRLISISTPPSRATDQIGLALRGR